MSRHLMLPLVVEPRYHDGFHDVVHAVGKQLHVELANAAAHNVDGDGHRHREFSCHDDGA